MLSNRKRKKYSLQLLSFRIEKELKSIEEIYKYRLHSSLFFRPDDKEANRRNGELNISFEATKTIEEEG